MASVYPSTGWATLRRNVLPGFAASDIIQGAPVCVASSADQGFIMCTTATQKPVGIARDYAVAGDAVAVYDIGNELRTNVGGNGAGASFSRQAFIGVIGTSSVTHPQSGVAVSAPLLGQVAPGSPSVVGGSGSSLYAIGVAYESAAVGDQALFRVEPQILSGLINP